MLNNNNKSRNDIRQTNEATSINQNTMNKTKPNDYESYWSILIAKETNNCDASNTHRIGINDAVNEKKNLIEN